jgi:hypothetical protein
MSTTGKAVLWIVGIVIVVGGGIWWWMASHPSNGSMDMNNMPGMTQTSTAAMASSTASSSLPQGDSDQSIDQEMTDINAQMNGLSSDTANVNQSMNDQPVQQAE